jgi:hypothetical protein
LTFSSAQEEEGTHQSVLGMDFKEKVLSLMQVAGTKTET